VQEEAKAARFRLLQQELRQPSEGGWAEETNPLKQYDIDE
jgi:hypothetical protein